MSILMLRLGTQEVSSIHSSCGAVPAYLIECSSSSLPDLVLQIQSTSSSFISSAAVPVYVIHWCSSTQSTSSSILVPCSLPHPVSNSSLPYPVLQFQSTSPVQKTLISLVAYFCSVHFFSNLTFFELLLYMFISFYM